MREKILFDDNWIFHRGDINIDFPKDKGPVYTQSKTERKLWGPASKYYKGTANNFDKNKELCTDKWEHVTLPHDYVIIQTPTESENSTLGFLKYENAWYRKKFTLNEQDIDKRLTLLFEGVATHATIYLNGCLLKHNFCGYNSFEVNISDVAECGENVLVVYVETDEHEGWWYEGGGIYRHVWLCKTDTVAVDLWGVYVAPEKSDEETWKVKIETEIVNDRYETVNAEVTTTIYDPDMKIAAVCKNEIEIPQREKRRALSFIEVKNPLLWDIKNPNLYTVDTVIRVDGKECDTYKTRTGFRTVEIDPENGLFLNGKHVKIKGVCAHQDFGITGKAVADNIQRYKIEMIKEMGANGYRTSHYPHSEATMDALDELGFIVMDETRWFESTDEGKAQLEMLIKRDRNRPSVVFWSVGNEEPHHSTEVGRRICRNLSSFVKKLDDTRFVMTAVDNPVTATVYDETDVIGINYRLGNYDEIHKKYPSKAVFASECCATSTTRGWYDANCPEKGYFSAYDKDTTAWFLGREKTWKFIEERPWVFGEYQWTAFEHRGETVWPRLCSLAGAIDLYLQKKDAFYQNMTHWLERPIVHLLPHWNFSGREGEIIEVWAYTNCDELELFLNGKSLGKKEIEKYGHGEWQVKYQPGILRVEGFCNGKVVCSDERITTGNAQKLNLKLENKIEKANGVDIAIISCYCTDSEGREVPNATPYVSFNTNGLGCVIGTGSDNTDHSPVYLSERRMYAGRITVAVRVGLCEGELKVYATSENLADGVLTIQLKKED